MKTFIHTKTLLFSSLLVAFLFFGFSSSMALNADGGKSISVSITVFKYNGADESCYGANDAQITITARGGDGNYMYSIDQGQSFHSGNVFSNLEGGRNYVIVVKDNSGNKSEETWQWVSKVYNPVTISYVNTYDSDCGNKGTGRIEFGAYGGTGKIIYSINGSIFQNSGNFGRVSPGVYNIVAKDVNGCTSDFRQVVISSKTSMEVSLKIDNSGKGGKTGSVTVHAESGVAPYKYSLDGGAFVTSNIFRDVAAGSHTVMVVDSKGCTVVKTFEMNIEEEGTGARKMWTGRKSSEWHDAANWNDLKVPTQHDEVWIVKESAENMPEITVPSFVKDIRMEGDVTLLITSTLSLSGEISGTEHAINAIDGVIRFVGETEQSFLGKMFFENRIKDIIINNDLNLKSQLDIYGQVSFEKDSKVLTTNNFLVLKSTASHTASVGVMHHNEIKGNVTVEKYIPALKGWKFLSVPTVSDRPIHKDWQEGQEANNTSLKGYGIQITGEMSDWKAKGFDAQSYTPSVKTYNKKNNTWVGIKSTLAPFSSPDNAYMVFVRGDRTANSLYSEVTETVLRTYGTLRSGDQETVEVEPGLFTAVGNPYASGIDLSKIKTDRPMFFYYWDQNLGSNFGAYQTLAILPGGRVEAIPGSGSYKTRNAAIIPAGEAFFAFNKEGGMLQLTEDAKVVSSSNAISRGGNVAGNDNSVDLMKVNLYTVNQNGTLLLNDGVMQTFSPVFNNDIDEFDGAKYANSTENLSIRKSGKLLSVESKAFAAENDTTFLNLTGIGYRTYKFQISFNQEGNAKQGFLVDRYTNTTTPIEFTGTTEYQFTVVNNAGSKAADRFMIVFRQMAPQPVDFTSVNVAKKQQDAEVSWKVENEKNVAKYQVERSANGTDFQVIGEVAATNAPAYNFTDSKTFAGWNYYRVVSVDIDGKKIVSNVVKVMMDGVAASYAVSPNPVVGNEINVTMNVKQGGAYFLTVRNQIVQPVASRQIVCAGGRNKVTIEKNNLSAGVYTVEITNPNGESSVIRFVK